MKEKISYTVYKPAPESAKFYLNEKCIDIPAETNAGYYAAIGDHKQTIDIVKRYIRKKRKESNIVYCYGFYYKNSNTFTFISSLYADPESLTDKLYCFKEAKRYFKENPTQYIVEKGKIIPGENPKKETEKQTIEIDLERPILVKAKIK